ncbi:TPA: hypothetical protein ACF39M_000882 [Enterococcus hirae]
MTKRKQNKKIKKMKTIMNSALLMTTVVGLLAPNVLAASNAVSEIEMIDEVQPSHDSGTLDLSMPEPEIGWVSVNGVDVDTQKVLWFSEEVGFVGNDVTLFAEIVEGYELISPDRVTIYMETRREYSSSRTWDQAYTMIRKAENVAPGYFEVYKIRAFINAENNNLMDAIDSYRIAIENAHEDIEIASVYYLFSVFYTLKLEDFILAKECIEIAESYVANEPRITLEKGRVYMYLGEYGQALTIFKSINKNELKTDKILNQYTSKVADLYRRMASNYGNRDKELKHDYLSRAIKEINKLQNIDSRTCAILIRTLIDLTFNFSCENSKALFIETFRTHIKIIQNNKSGYIRRLRERVRLNDTILPIDVVKKASNFGISFSEKAKNIKDPNRGIVTKLTESFGFIKNSDDDFYFKIYDIKYSNPSLGDEVIFSVKDASKGKIAFNIKKV